MKPKKPEYWIELDDYDDFTGDWRIKNGRGECLVESQICSLKERDREMKAFSKATGLPIRRAKP